VREFTSVPTPLLGLDGKQTDDAKSDAGQVLWEETDKTTLHITYLVLVAITLERCGIT
jgi:hypothetical protein